MKKRIRLKLENKKQIGKPSLSTKNKIQMRAKILPVLRPVESKLYLFKARYTLGGFHWKFHPNDVDPWPSRPHGDQIGGPHKLNVYTGDIINRHTKQVVKTISKKERSRLWNDKYFLKVVESSKQYA